MSGEKVPAAERWTAADPKISAALREAQYSLTAEDDADKSKPKKDRKQLKSRWILARLDDEPDAATLCHELGHAYGFDDLYWQMDHRDDLAYLGDLALMDRQPQMPHHAGYHKWQAEWITVAGIVDVPKPAHNAPTRAEALLVPVEYWDPGMEAAVRAAYPGVGAKVAQLMRIDLGGDMGMFDIVEARQRGKDFSQHLPATPFLLVTNAIVPGTACATPSKASTGLSCTGSRRRTSSTPMRRNLILPRRLSWQLKASRSRSWTSAPCTGRAGLSGSSTRS